MKLGSINNEIISIWQKGIDNNSIDSDLAPVQYYNFNGNGLLFIGVNPSFSLKGLRQLVQGTKYEKWSDDKVKSIFLFKNFQDFKSDMKYLENRALEKYSYFSKFDHISSEVNESWDHIDLFFERITSQSKLAKKYLDKKYALKDFAQKQFDLSLSLIEKIKPKLIIVVNALASHIIKQQFFPDFIELNEHGFNYFQDKYPIIFSGMLTGQRALDNHSLDRLVWHVKYILDKTK
jgi:hypothetical protein